MLQFVRICEDLKSAGRTLCSFFEHLHFFSPTLVWLQTASFQREIKIGFHSRVLLFSSIFSCFSLGLELSLYFGLFSVLSQLSLSSPEPFGRGTFLEGDCHSFQCCPSPLWGSGQLLEVPGSSPWLPLLCWCCHEQWAKAVPQCVLRCRDAAASSSLAISGVRGNQFAGSINRVICLLGFEFLLFTILGFFCQPM